MRWLLILCCTSACSFGIGDTRLLVCGDSVRESDEACDDGNTIDGDGCSRDCLSTEVCGNGVVDRIVGEGCDDGVAGQSGDGCSSTCTPEVALWENVSPTPVAGRFYHSLAYDAARQRVVMFGGQTADALLGDTWTWDGVVWFPVQTLAAPAARAGPAMAYDRLREQVVLFGGTDVSGTRNDTWTWDGVDWTERHPTIAPPPRWSAALTYDRARGVVVLFGGNDANYEPLADTWEWDGMEWRQRVTTTSPNPPDWTRSPALAYDEQRQRVVLFYGNGTWEYDGVDWFDRGPGPTNIQNGATLSYDSMRQRVVLFGGRLSSGNVFSAESWLWDGTQWTKPSPSTSPPARYLAASVYNEAAEQVVMFGGATHTPLMWNMLDDTWTWNGAEWIEPPEQALAPAKRELFAFAFDPVHGEALLFGGWHINGFYDDLWAWRDRRWRRIDAGVTPRPTARGFFSGTSAAYDQRRQRFVIFGGRDVTAASWVDDTWEWDGTRWLAPAPAVHPAARMYHAMTYDAARGVTLLFGGVGDGPGGFAVFGDTWTWDGDTWTKLSPASSPRARSAPQLAYDPVRERVVLFGGYFTDSNEVDNETWEWDGTTWTQLAPATSPPARWDGMLAYDAQRQRVVLFGGTNASGQTSFGDAWEWDGTTWTPIATDRAPSPRTGGGMVHDPVRRELVLFGGGFLNRLDDTWTLRYLAPGQRAERCVAAVDDDRDGLAGCADPDCWGRCTPACPPGSTCPDSAPRCGDGVCSAIEDARICDADC